jgi:hypothetical protein
VLDLLSPSNMREHYIHQLKQTIHAYSKTQVVLGEVVQNAIDAIVLAGAGEHNVSISIDFDSRTVIIKDDGDGFPNNPSLLFLGGSEKRTADKKLFGLVGVGLKVVLFRTNRFILSSNLGGENFRVELRDAYRFDSGQPLELEIPDTFQPDPNPLSDRGTRVEYAFPEGAIDDPIAGFLLELQQTCLPAGTHRGLGKQLQRAVDNGTFGNRFAGLLSVYLRRFTYCGDVLNRLGEKPELANSTLEVSVKCSDPISLLGNDLGELFDGETEFAVSVPMKYLMSDDTRSWVPNPRPGVYRESLGPGGEGLDRTWNGINRLSFQGADDYEQLLTDRYGNVKGDIEAYRTRLFPNINGIFLDISRIPTFEEFLPGGSRRVISANGVVTSHEIDLTKGRNQEYVRCFDLVVDVNAELNYGKNQLTNNHLVSLVRRYINDAYATTIQTAAGRWVGRISQDEPEHDDFLSRADIGADGLTLRKVPRDENDVIALFFELAGRGFFPEYKLFGLSQKDQYDARALIRRAGESEDPAVPVDDRQLQVVEFKVVMSGILSDLEREAKTAREMHLLVAWDKGSFVSERFAVADIEHSRYFPERVFPRAQHYLEDTRSGAQIQVLLLRPIVEELAREEAEE